jgi:hypothetical protein
MAGCVVSALGACLLLQLVLVVSGHGALLEIAQSRPVDPAANYTPVS